MIGYTELILILALALLFFGPRRLPQVGRALGKAIGEFKRGLYGDDEPGNGKGNGEEDGKPPAG